METWEQSAAYPGYKVKAVQHNGCTINVHRPVLTSVERSKREGQIKKAAAYMLAAMDRRGTA